MTVNNIQDDRLDMLLEAKRFKSFKNWPFKEESECNALKMAKAGFFWIGNDKDFDLVQCFVCNKELDGWESTDNPWKEHESHASTCPFVVIGKPEEELTIKQIIELWSSMSKNLLELRYKQYLNELEQKAESAKFETSKYINVHKNNK